MKIFVSGALWVLLSATLYAHGVTVKEVVTEYMKVKNALVDGNAKAAALAAGGFVATVNNVNHVPEVFTAEKWDATKKALLEHAKVIELTNEIEKQRVAFAHLSLALWPVVKVAEYESTVFYQYCPMKKAHWLSTNSKIENPYYGQSMLTCGKTTERTK